MNLSRRTFIKLTGTTVVCTCLGGLGTSSCASNPMSDTPPAPTGSYRIRDDRVHVTLSKVGPLLGMGRALKLTLEKDSLEQKMIVVHPSETDYRAFANECTQNGKELVYLHNEGLLACSGRSSRFDLAGDVIHGPAEEALVRYHLWQESGELVIEI
jgi:Rieske Fe-S protein